MLYITLGETSPDRFRLHRITRWRVPSTPMLSTELHGANRTYRWDPTKTLPNPTPPASLPFFVIRSTVSLFRNFIPRAP